MHKCLHLVCPTDCLESIINDRFEYENYFYTSLGNSVMFDGNTLCIIERLIKKHDIREVSLVLSINNRVVFDALENQKFSKIRGLKSFYANIKNQKTHSIALQHLNNKQFVFLSYYLNKKINKLKLGLNEGFIKPLKISGKIYNKKENSFNCIYSDLIYLEKYHLN